MTEKAQKKGSFTIHTPDKKLLLLAAALLLGLFLIFAAGMRGTHLSERNKTGSENPLDDYIKDMEERLCETVSHIKGAGSTRVFITVENSFETVYASNAKLDESGDDTKSTKTTQKELAYMTSKTDGEAPVVIKQICPKLCGVLVVCEGGERADVRDEITKAVSTAVGISKNKIYVSGGIHES